MADSIYSPPESDVTVHDADSNEYYVVGTMKFLLLCIGTMNLYLIYWFYKNWSLVKDTTEEDMLPPLRGFFYIFFVHSLFGLVDQTLEQKGKEFQWSASGLATIIVVLTLLSNIVGWLDTAILAEKAMMLIGLLLLLAIPEFVLKAQRAINVACDDPEGKGNSSLTAANIAWLVVGAVAWIFVLIGYYAIFFDPAFSG